MGDQRGGASAGSAGSEDAAERIKELVLYGPVGFASYLRDTLPSFVRLFVSRGRVELSGTVGRTADTVPDRAWESATQLLRLASDCLGVVRERVDEAIVTLGAREPGDTAASGPATSAPAGGPASADRDAPETDEAEGETTSDPGAEPTLRLASSERFPIDAYDELSASDIVDRLEELERDELETVRRYEQRRRARSTVLGKIEQLTRSA